MAKYNTFAVQFTKNGRLLLVTSSARKAKGMLSKGLRVEVWSENRKVETIYTHTNAKLDTYIAAEREHIRTKQAAAEKRNKLRRARRENST
jgi:hypothetical protein